MYLANIVLPSFEMLKECELKQKVPVGLYTAQRAGALMVDPTAEELSKTLQSLPFWDKIPGN